MITCKGERMRDSLRAPELKESRSGGHWPTPRSPQKPNKLIWENLYFGKFDYCAKRRLGNVERKDDLAVIYLEWYFFFT